MKRKFMSDSTYIQMARAVAQESKAHRLKVGCILVKDGLILSAGYNGTPSGEDNKCEDSNGITKQNVVHAEANALLSAKQLGLNTDGATCYVTHSCCINCGTALLASGVRHVVYAELYRDASPLKFLQDHGVEVALLDTYQGGM